MGPMLVAYLAGFFCIFAAMSACLGFVCQLVALRMLIRRHDRVLSLCMIGVGGVGGLTGLLVGEWLRWNIIGEAIHTVWAYAWAAVGFGWSSAFALMGILFFKFWQGSESED